MSICYVNASQEELQGQPLCHFLCLSPIKCKNRTSTQSPAHRITCSKSEVKGGKVKMHSFVSVAKARAFIICRHLSNNDDSPHLHAYFFFACPCPCSRQN